MTVTTATSTVDTSAMVCIHVALRREFRLAPDVVARVDDGDVRRARVVADHVAFLAEFLHHHHTTEDRHLWPLLLERVPQELAPVVHLMESQHETVDAALQEIAPLVEQWRTTAGAAARDRLAALLRTLHAALVEHLDAEEQHLLPLASRTVTQAEWDALGEAGAQGTPRSKMPLVLGMFQYEGDPDVVAAIVAEAPPLVRRLVPPLARRAYRRHALRVHGTATP